MTGGRIVNCPGCGRLIIHGQKCLCAATVSIELHAGECWKCKGPATWWWHGEDAPGTYTVDCPVCIEEVCAENEGLGQAHNELLRQQDRIVVLERRIEEMTADQPADSRRLPNQVRPSNILIVGATIKDYVVAGVRQVESAFEAAVRADERARISAAASSVQGLSVCVAQLAAIRQLRELCMLYGGEKNWMPIRQVLAVLDGVPGTTQPRTEEKKI